MTAAQPTTLNHKNLAYTPTHKYKHFAPLSSFSPCPNDKDFNYKSRLNKIDDVCQWLLTSWPMARLMAPEHLQHLHSLTNTTTDFTTPAIHLYPVACTPPHECKHFTTLASFSPCPDDELCAHESRHNTIDNFCQWLMPSWPMERLMAPKHLQHQQCLTTNTTANLKTPAIHLYPVAAVESLTPPSTQQSPPMFSNNGMSSTLCLVAHI